MPHDHNRQRYEKAALLVAQGEITFKEIAAQLEINIDTLLEWRREQEFKSLVGRYVDEALEVVKGFGIAQLHNRVKSLQDRHRRLNAVIAERSASEEMQGVPGGSTGLIVRDVKVIGSGKDAERVDVYEVDTGTLAELRQIEMQAAKELGQWAERSEQHVKAEVKEATPSWIYKDFADLTPEELEQLNKEGKELDQVHALFKQFEKSFAEKVEGPAPDPPAAGSV